MTLCVSECVQQCCINGAEQAERLATWFAMNFQVSVIAALVPHVLLQVSAAVAALVGQIKGLGGKKKVKKVRDVQG